MRLKTDSGSEPLPPELAAMIEITGRAEGIFEPSPFWKKLALQHAAQLADFGFANFKRTINLKYFSWGVLGILAHQIMPLLWWRLRNGRGNPLRAKMMEHGAHDSQFEKIRSKLYAVYVALLYERVRHDAVEGALETCAEPRIGNPILVEIGDDVVSTQDICNAVHEYSRVERLMDWDRSPRVVLEIGAGYGRVAAVFLRMNPGVKYWIVDIPPALYVSQRYLSEVFPEKRLFAFRPFSTIAEFADDIASSDICFFMPDQLDLLPAKSVGATICISNLHEMTRPQIDFYFQQIDRLTAGIFYTKQWMRSIAKENGFTISRGDYPVRAGWVTLLDGRHPIQSWFFEAAYRI